MGNPVIDMTNETVGLLTVRERAASKVFDGGKRAMWLCDCACSRTREVSGIDLRRRRILSCGCKGPAKVEKETAAKRPHNLIWTQQRLQALASGRAAGLSASDICEQINNLDGQPITLRAVRAKGLQMGMPNNAPRGPRPL